MGTINGTGVILGSDTILGSGVVSGTGSALDVLQITGKIIGTISKSLVDGIIYETEIHCWMDSNLKVVSINPELLPKIYQLETR